jgi:hypothetical protein
VAPTDFFDRDAKGSGNALAFVRAGRPAAFGDRSHTLHGELRSLGDFFDRQPGLLKKMLNGADGHDQVSRDERDFNNSIMNNTFGAVKSSVGLTLFRVIV